MGATNKKWRQTKKKSQKTKGDGQKRTMSERLDSQEVTDKLGYRQKGETDAMETDQIDKKGDARSLN